MKATITNRVKPCDCGCQGRDPQHARRFERRITSLRTESGQEERVLAYREPLRVIESGLAKAPWSEELVRVVRCETTIGGKSVILGWFFAR